MDICEGKKCSCNAFGELVEGTEQQKCLNVNLKKKKKKNQRDPSPQHFTHNAPVCHVRPLQRTDQGLKDSGFI